MGVGSRNRASRTLSFESTSCRAVSLYHRDFVRHGNTAYLVRTHRIPTTHSQRSCAQSWQTNPYKTWTSSCALNMTFQNIAILEAAMTTMDPCAETALKINIDLDAPAEPHPQAPLHMQERRLSAEILSLIEEAFPGPTFASEHTFTFVDEDPPVYNNTDDPPQYSTESHGTLIDRLSVPEMSKAFSIRVCFKRIPMEPPFPDSPVEVFSDLMLVSPAMTFDLFLRQIQAKTRGHILASKQSLPGECMVHAFYVVFRERGQGLLKRDKKIKLMIKPSNWAAAVASLKDGKASEIQVKFWTETPGSIAEQTRRERMEKGMSRNMWWALWS
ncbi:hypothetical protein HII31_09495 [Pseudocercospora fuligena]|uniref:Uncharacterized protein n=1 Tax=Pseudocercospora fuligena TaxID=685502 RepID=A0A8H6VE82_9PEZI|nr:hypothetical protein HII31_09495 [Pseudocercospora fuligena]